MPEDVSEEARAVLVSLGDEVMFVSVDPASVCRIALDVFTLG
jgi:hypothetical protein